MVIQEEPANQYENVGTFLSGCPSIGGATVTNLVEFDGGVEGGGDRQPVKGVQVTVDFELTVQSG